MYLRDIVYDILPSSVEVVYRTLAYSCPSLLCNYIRSHALKGELKNFIRRNMQTKRSRRQKENLQGPGTKRAKHPVFSGNIGAFTGVCLEHRQYILKRTCELRLGYF